MKTSNIIWNPHVATQLLLSSDNDLTPWAQVWDFRYIYRFFSLLFNYTSKFSSFSLFFFFFGMA